MADDLDDMIRQNAQGAMRTRSRTLRTANRRTRAVAGDIRQRVLPLTAP